MKQQFGIWHFDVKDVVVVDAHHITSNHSIDLPEKERPIRIFLCKEGELLPICLSSDEKKDFMKAYLSQDTKETG